MTSREKLCLRILLFVARCLGREDWRKQIDKFDLYVSTHREEAVLA